MGDNPFTDEKFLTGQENKDKVAEQQGLEIRSVGPANSVRAMDADGVNAAWKSIEGAGLVDVTHEAERIVVTGNAAAQASQVNSALAAAWPIGSVFLSVLATNPATLLGVGTWERISEGRMLVGQKAGDADFGTVEGTGGAKTKTFSEASHDTDAVDLEHDHTAAGTTGGADNDHTHTAWAKYDPPNSVATSGVSAGHAHAFNVSTGQALGEIHLHYDGLDGAQDVLNPFFTIYIWKRVS